MVIATSISKTKLFSQDAGAINFETKWSYNLQVVVKDVVKYPSSLHKHNPPPPRHKQDNTKANARKQRSLYISDQNNHYAEPAKNLK
jgi:hypothetical protein